MANKMVRKIQFTQKWCSQVFKNLGDPNDWFLEAFSDASLANLLSGGTQGGYLVFLCGKEKKNNLLCGSRTVSGAW